MDESAEPGNVRSGQAVGAVRAVRAFGAFGAFGAFRNATASSPQGSGGMGCRCLSAVVSIRVAMLILAIVLHPVLPTRAHADERLSQHAVSDPVPSIQSDDDQPVDSPQSSSGEQGDTAPDHATGEAVQRFAPANVIAQTLPPVIHADGQGLPDGSGSVDAGAHIYAQQCAGCHGIEGQGGSALELVGDRDLLTTEYPDRGIAVIWPYAPPLYDYVRRAMPPDAPWSLSADETYAVVAHLLNLNGLLQDGQRVDAAFLSTLVMPNRDGFVDAP